MNDTALVSTTFVTDLPLYIEGDFSSSGANTAGGKPLAILLIITIGYMFIQNMTGITVASIV